VNNLCGRWSRLVGSWSWQVIFPNTIHDNILIMLERRSIWVYL